MSVQPAFLVVFFVLVLVLVLFHRKWKSNQISTAVGSNPRNARDDFLRVLGRNVHRNRVVIVDFKRRVGKRARHRVQQRLGDAKPVVDQVETGECPWLSAW